MKFIETGLHGVLKVVLERRNDERGFFARSWCRREFAEAGVEVDWVQANMARSTQAGTLRGLHFQRAPYEETKLIRCTRGSVFDVAVDVRPSSSFFGRWVGVELDEDTGDSLLIPSGFAHGYQTLNDHSEITYMTTAFYEPSAVTGYRYDDPAFAIDWPLRVSAISSTDMAWPLVADQSA